VEEVQLEGLIIIAKPADGECWHGVTRYRQILRKEIPDTLLAKAISHAGVCGRAEPVAELPPFAGIFTNCCVGVFTGESGRFA
jgi:hypothetical protein